MLLLVIWALAVNLADAMLPVFNRPMHPVGLTRVQPFNIHQSRAHRSLSKQPRLKALSNEDVGDSGLLFDAKAVLFNAVKSGDIRKAQTLLEEPMYNLDGRTVLRVLKICMFTRCRPEEDAEFVEQLLSLAEQMDLDVSEPLVSVLQTYYNQPGKASKWLKWARLIVLRCRNFKSGGAVAHLLAHLISDDEPLERRLRLKAKNPRAASMFLRQSTSLDYFANSAFFGMIRTMPSENANYQLALMAAKQGQTELLKFIGAFGFFELNCDLLIASVRGSRAETVQYLLDEGTSANCHASNGQHVLVIASSKSAQPEILLMLISAGADVAKYGLDATREAACASQYLNLAVLLERDAMPHPDALLCAAMKGDAASVDLLIEAGADPMHLGGKACIEAGALGHLAVVQSLLETARGILDDSGYLRLLNDTAMRVVTTDHTNVMEDLLARGARIDETNGEYFLLAAVIRSRVNMAKLILDNSVWMSVASLNTALRYAYTPPELPKLLIDYGADLHNNNDEFLIRVSMNCYPETLMLLLNTYPFAQKSLDRAFLETVSEGKAKCAQILLNHGASTRKQDRKLLRMATAKCSHETINVLSAHGVSVSASPSLNVQLGVAVSQCDSKVVEALLNAGASASFPMNIPLLMTLKRCAPDVIQTLDLLLSNGADAKAYLNQPIIIASETCPEAIPTLVAHGADLSTRGNLIPRRALEKRKSKVWRAIWHSDSRLNRDFLVSYFNAVSQDLAPGTGAALEWLAEIARQETEFYN